MLGNHRDRANLMYKSLLHRLRHALHPNRDCPDPLPSGMIGFIEVAGSVSIPKSAGVKVQAYTDSTSQIQAEVLQDSKPGSQWVGLEVHDK